MRTTISHARARRYFGAFASLAATIAVASTCSGDKTTGPGPTPSAVALAGGDAQAGTAGQALPIPVSVKVTDSRGSGVSGVSIAWEVVSGGGSVSPTTSTTGATGIGSAMWTLGHTAGTNQLRARISSSSSIPAVTFSAIGLAGPAAGLTFSVPPTSTTAGAAIAPAIQVTAQDAFGNTAAFTGNVTLSITSGTGTAGATLGGTVTQTAAGGVASFASVNITKAGTGYTLTATGAGPITGTSAAFNITAAAATQIAVDTGDAQTATVNTAVATPPAVIVKDQYGNPKSGVGVTFAVATGGGTVVPTTAVATDASGIAAVTSWTLGPAMGTNTLTATATGLTGSPVTFTATGQAGAASTIAVNAGNNQTATAGAAVATPPSVIVKDAQGNPVSGVSIIFAVATGGGTVVPTTAVTTDVSGIAAVTSWTLGATAGSNTLTATSAGLTGSPVTFTATGTAGAASTIAVNAGNNQTGIAGAAVATPPSVVVKDALGNPVSGVSVTFAVATGGGTVVPTTAVTTDASGIAAVTSWTLGATAGSNTLTATSAGLTGSPVTFTATGSAGTASTIALNAGDGQTATVNTAVATAPSVIVKDGNGNPVAGVSVTFAVATGGGTVVPTTAVATDANGVAAATSWTLGTTAGANTLTATASGLTGSPVTFTATGQAGTPTQIAVNGGNNQSATAGMAVTIAPSAIVKDLYGNPKSGVDVTFAVASGGGTVNPTTPVTTDANGIATATSWTLGPTVGSNTLTATATGLVGSPSVTFTATGVVGTASIIALNGGNGQTAVAGTAVTTPPSAIVTDAHGNPVSGINVTFAVASGGGTVVPTTAVATNVAGIAQASTWTLGPAAGSNTLTATATGLSGSPVTFTATGIAGGATQIALNGGDGQTATVNAAVATAPSVIVKDANGNPVAGTEVTFAVATGGGTVVPTTAVTTDAGGIARPTSWTLGTTAGSNTLTATASGLSGSPVTFTATGIAGTASSIALNAGDAQTATVHTAVTTAPSVVVKDQFGNPKSGVPVTFAVATGGGTVVPTTAVSTDANGIAAVTSWTLGTAAGNNTLTATASGLTGSPVTFTATGEAGTAARLVWTGQPTDVVAGDSVKPAVTIAVADTYGNTLTTLNTGTVTLALTVPGGATLLGGGATTVVNGVASFAGLRVNKSGTYTLTPTTNVAGVTTLPASTSFTVSAGTPSQLLWTGQPSNVASGSAITPAVTVSVADSNGNVVTTLGSGTVTLALTTPNGATLMTGAGPVTVASGVATFSNLRVDKVGTYTLTPATTVPGVTGLPVSGSFTVSPGAARRLLWTQQPSNVLPNTAMAPAVKVSVADSNSNVLTTLNTGTVTLALTVAGGATLTGGGPVTVSSGVATFSNLRVDNVGTYTLTPTTSVSGVTAAGRPVSASFMVSLAATQLAFTTQPADGSVGASFGVVVTARDAGNNTASAFTGDVTIEITSGTGTAGATLGGTTTVAAVAGVATFTGLSIDKYGTGYTLTATATGLTNAVSTAFRETLTAAYVTNRGSGTVSVINAANNSVFETIPVGTGPWGVATTPASAAQQRAYVTLADVPGLEAIDSVAVVDVASGTLLSQLPVGDKPTGISIAPNGDVYTVNFTSGNLHIIRGDAVLAGPYSVGSEPIAVVARQDQIWIADAVQTQVARYRTSDLGLDTAFQIGGVPWAMVARPNAPSSRLLWVSIPELNYVVLIDTTDYSLVKLSVGTNPMGIAFTPDGHYAYVAESGSNTVSVIDATSCTSSTCDVVATIGVGNNPQGVGMSVAGDYAYVTNYNDGTVSVISTASNTVVGTVPVGTNPQNVATVQLPAP
jgi:adhesin/invasin